MGTNLHLVEMESDSLNEWFLIFRGKMPILMFIINWLSITNYTLDSYGLNTL